MQQGLEDGHHAAKNPVFLLRVGLPWLSLLDLGSEALGELPKVLLERREVLNAQFFKEPLHVAEELRAPALVLVAGRQHPDKQDAEEGCHGRGEGRVSRAGRDHLPDPPPGLSAYQVVLAFESCDSHELLEACVSAHYGEGGALSLEDEPAHEAEELLDDAAHCGELDEDLVDLL